jgi:hypothetical protein
VPPGAGGLASLYGIPYTPEPRAADLLRTSEVDRDAVVEEFKALLEVEDIVVQRDVGELYARLEALAAKRPADRRHMTHMQVGARRLCRLRNGRCRAFYACESEPGEAIYLLGFCRWKDRLGNIGAPANRIYNVP